MASPVPPLDLFAAKFAVVTKLALLTHSFVFALFVFCGRGLPMLAAAGHLTSVFTAGLGQLAVIVAQLVLAIRSFAVPIPACLQHYRHLISSKGFEFLYLIPMQT